jgi:hypothetical protein
MGRAWTKETPTKLGVTSNMQFAERDPTSDTDRGSYIYGKSASKTLSGSHLNSDSDGAV